MSGSDIHLPQVLVCQRGARHRYMIPRLLQSSGMLATLYTDSTVYSPVGQLAKRFHGMGFRQARMDALASRIPSGIPRRKIRSVDNLFLEDTHWLGANYRKWGLRGADAVYSMCGEEFRFLQYAKEQGAKILVDVFIHPGTSRIVENEQFLVQGKQGQNYSVIEAEDEHLRRSCELADTILCPSGWVAAGVREYVPQCAEKIRVVPYGSSIDVRDSINKSPKVGRILFAGRDPLRKGLHYLADSARLLRDRGMEIDVRVAGISADEVKWIRNRGELNLLGTLPMEQMHNEFWQADVFVLPSLSEGQAGVLLEAMACGCPVIATRESGVDFMPGCGVTVPTRNTESLADALVHVIGNRDIRNELARGALRQAAEFSLEAWKFRLEDVVRETVLGKVGGHVK